MLTGDCVIIGPERSIRESLCHSQARAQQGSILCETPGCIKDVTSRAQGHFVKPMSLNSLFANDWIQLLFTFQPKKEIFSEHNPSLSGISQYQHDLQQLGFGN